VVLTLSLAIYGLIVASVGQPLLSEQPLAEIAFYAIAGIVWVIPASWLTRWMQSAPPLHPPSGD
jgi:hypothetical protein